MGTLLQALYKHRKAVDSALNLNTAAVMNAYCVPGAVLSVFLSSL